MKILVDMNLSPLWVEPLSRGGFAAVHWSKVGDPRAPDRTLMQWAREHGYVVFTHDLDFGTLLTLTREVGRVWCRSEHRTSALNISGR